MALIKVAIIDDDFTWIKLTIDHIHKEEDMVVLWSVTNKETAKHYANGKDVNVILMNNKPEKGQDFNNISTIREIAEISKAKIIMMTSDSQEELILNFMSAEVANYILKDDYTSIPVIIRLTCNRVFSPLEVIFKDYDKTKSQLRLSALTPTEKELYLLKQQGLTTVQIATKTHKSEGTIRNQLSKVYKKLKSSVSRN
jgi:DNA-binding NarL/FixJ family response regulator